METTETRRARPRTIRTRQMPLRRYVLRVVDEPQHWRPQTREDCANVQRPCPYVGCRWNLYLDVTRNGGIKLNFPDLEPDEMQHSCALDVAEDGELDMASVADIMNLSRERIRQIEGEAMVHMADNADWMGVDLRELFDETLDVTCDEKGVLP